MEYLKNKYIQSIEEQEHKNKQVWKIAFIKSVQKLLNDIDGEIKKCDLDIKNLDYDDNKGSINLEEKMGKLLEEQKKIQKKQDFLDTIVY